jgi:hypothetical protein
MRVLRFLALTRKNFGFHSRNFGVARKNLAKSRGKQKEGSRLPSFAFTKLSLR